MMAWLLYAAATAPAAPAIPPQVMQPAQTDPLDNLREIHLPQAIDTWPNAPGWWLLALIAVGLISFALFKLYQHWRRNQYRREALSELDSLHSSQPDPLLFLTEFNALLKRVALTGYARHEVAGLHGENWVSFLDRTANTHDFSMGCGQALIETQYTETKTDDPTQRTTIDRSGLHRIGRAWIKRHSPQVSL